MTTKLTPEYMLSRVLYRDGLMLVFEILESELALIQETLLLVI